MKLSFNWIKEYIDGVDFSKISIEELNDKITLSIAEVEGILEYGRDVQDVVVGEIRSITPHPTSSKLSVVLVNIGSENVQSVCGAKNIYEGMYVPFAKVGGSIINHLNISHSILDGVDSYGVLCSAYEIGISDDHTGVLDLDKSYTIGTDIKNVLPIDDLVIDIDNKSLTSRPDLWGHYGFAREVAAVFGGHLKPLPTISIPHTLGEIDIDVVDKEKCNRYSAIRLSNISPAVSSWEIRIRLYYCGMRSLSLLVDLTNYVMLDLGQPLHAFDGMHIDRIVVKTPEQPIDFVTLDGVSRRVENKTLMIYNGEKPVAIAGIMGGQESEVTGDSSSILLESANFSAFSTRRSAINLGLRTEASNRYEKSLDTNMTTLAIKRFVYLLKLYLPNISYLSSITDIIIRQNKEISITIEKSYIDKYIGVILPSCTITKILRSLCFEVNVVNDLYEIVVPTFRTSKDISSKVDIIEEISRIYGYDNIVPKPLSIELKPLDYNAERITEYEIKDTLAYKFGLSEVNTYVWYDNAINKAFGLTTNGSVKVKNPQTVDSDTLRDSVIPSLLHVFDKNSRSFEDIGIFEIGHVFSLPKGSQFVKEEKELGVILASKKESIESLFTKAKGIVSFLSKSIKRTLPIFGNCNILDSWIDNAISNSIQIDSDTIGYISNVGKSIKPYIDKKWNVIVVSINFDKFVSTQRVPILYAAPSKYPEITMDFNFLVNSSVPFSDVAKHIQSYENPILLAYKFVEIYKGKQIEDNKKCLTFSFTIGSKERTLTNDDKEEFASALIAHMESKGYLLRK